MIIRKEVSGVTDWLAIKTEYVTTASSYRDLSKKYGVRYKTLADRGKAEGWVDARHHYREKAISAAEDALAEQHADRAVRFHSVADRLLDRIEELVADGGIKLVPKEIRALTSAMCDLRDVMGLKSNLDLREQEARIANLERQARDDEEKHQNIEIRISGELEEYSN